MQPMPRVLHDCSNSVFPYCFVCYHPAPIRCILNGKEAGSEHRFLANICRIFDAKQATMLYIQREENQQHQIIPRNATKK